MSKLVVSGRSSQRRSSMARKSAAQANRERLIEAMTPLVLLPAFQAYIQQLREMKDEAVRYMVDHTAIANERESLVARGEVRAYLAIIQDYESKREQLEQQAAEAVAHGQQ